MAELDLNLQKALAEEKTKRVAVGNDHDFRQLVEEHAAKREEKKEETKPLTKDDLARANELLGKSLGFRPEKKKEKEPDETEKKEAIAADDKKEDAEKVAAGDTGDEKVKEEKPEPKKDKIKVSKRAEIDPIDIATAAAARTAEQILSASTKASKEVSDKRVGVEESLTEDERGEYEVFQEMAKDARYKELPKQYLSFIKKSEEYQRKWEADHPDQEFNPQSSDHDAFYHKVQPKYSEIDHKKAIARLANASSNNQEIEKLTAEQRRLKAELAVRELEPAVRQTQLAVLGEIIKGMDENVLAAIQQTNDFNKYADANPVEADIIREIAARIEPFVEGLIHIDEDKESRIDIDEKKDSHREWAKYLQAKEAELPRMTRAQRTTEDGRLLITRGEYYRLPASSRPGYAFLDGRMLLELRIAEEATKAKEQYQRELKKAEARAKALGWSKAEATKAAQNGDKKEEKPPEKKEPAKSPEAISASRVDTSGESKPMGDDGFLEKSASILFRR